jgi:glucose/arabinose dehydrogenase
MTRLFRWLAAGTALGALACSSDTNGPTDTTPPASFTIALQPIDTIGGALYLTAPAGDSRKFVVTQQGEIFVIKNGTLLSTPFLDLRGTVFYDGEEGLLSMAFHPNYASNGYFYVYYTDQSGHIVIQRYRVSGNADVADAASAQTLLSFAHGVGNFGGLLTFGPDGKLYAGIGDGAGANTTGQDSSVYLGKILRFDVDAGSPYAVPSNNPYAGSGHGEAKPEIWAKGVRNPWRYTFDASTNRLYVADVGEAITEEVNVVSSAQAGVNYGWPVMEGDQCFLEQTCTETGLQLPVLTYTHATHGACAVIGGFVYRGTQLPEINGHYFYSDVCAGGVKSFRYSNDSGAVDKITWDVGTTGHAQSFGRDGSGELYFINNDGVISKIVRGTPATN